MGGPGAAYNQAQATQQQVSQEQLGIAQQQNQLQGENYQRMLTLEQPYIQQQQALATGSPQAALQAVAPQVGTIASGFNAAKERIMNSVPAGPARDYALAQLPLQENTAQAGILGQAVAQAPQNLANVGAGFGGYSLQEVGASLSGLSGANTTSSAVAGEANQAKANQIGMWSGLAQAAGSAAGGLSGTDLTKL